MRADIAETRRAKQRVAQRVRQNISVGMSNRPFIERNLNSADHQLSAFRETMKIVANAAAHAHAL
jgi:hypothetical protein